ncbi:MAG: thermonuclease family protein, partial [Nitrospinota bacterium]
RDFVEKELKNKEIYVTIVQTGQYQTGLGYFSVGGKDLATTLVSSGFAEVDERTARQFRDKKEQEAMLQVEAKAREQKLGMWIQGDDYESPVAYLLRTQKKKRGAGKH